MARSARTSHDLLRLDCASPEARLVSRVRAMDAEKSRQAAATSLPDLNSLPQPGSLVSRNEDAGVGLGPMSLGGLEQLASDRLVALAVLPSRQAALRNTTQGAQI